MKRCPKCGRTYTSDTQKFCTHDGGTLVPSAVDPNTTVRGDFPDQDKMSAPTQAISQNLVPPAPPDFNPLATVAGVKLPVDSRPPDSRPTIQASAPPPVESQPLPPAVAAQLPPPAAPPTPPVFVQPSAAPKKSKMPLIIGLLAVLLLVALAGLGAGYVFFLKPMLAQNQNLRAAPPPDVNQNENTNTEVSTPTPVPTPEVTPATEPPPFEPPPGAVEFVNSSANLDGKLAEHYLDFSFYYPKLWEKVPGSTNFVQVERRLPSGHIPERLTVGWYASNGSMGADRPLFPGLVGVWSANLARNFPGYTKLSEGDTKVNSYDAYEFRFQSVSRDPEKGEITFWGRAIFLPPAAGGSNGATLVMGATSLVPEITSATDVGVKGELPLILESFRLGAKR